MQNEYEIKKEMCEIGRRVYKKSAEEFTTAEWLLPTTVTSL